MPDKEDLSMNMLKCSMCREEKSSREFHLNRSRHGGRQSYCTPYLEEISGRALAKSVGYHLKRGDWKHTTTRVTTRKTGLPFVGFAQLITP